MRPAEEAAPDPGPVHIRARRHREAELAKQRKQIDALGSKADAVKAELDTVHTRSVGQRLASLSQPPLEPLGLGREELEASMAKIAAFEVKGGITNFAGPKDALPDALRPFITATGEGSVHLENVRVGSSPRMSTGSKGGGKGGGKGDGKGGGKGDGKGGGELSCQ